MAFFEGVTDAKSEARIFVAIQYQIDVFQAVVSAVAAFGLDADRTECQIQIIGNNQHIFFGYFFFFHPILHRFATQIHVGIGLEQQIGSAFKLVFGQAAQLYGLKRKRFFFGHKIQDFKPNVVSRIYVFGPNIAKANYQKFLHGSNRFGWCSVVKYSCKPIHAVNVK